MADGDLVPGESHESIELNSRSRFIEYFDDISTCLICLSKLNDPHLCPYCSKLYCYKCIQAWLISEHMNCPNCKHGVELDKLVKVRWFPEMSRLQRNCLKAKTTNGAATNVGASNKDLCSIHSKTLKFYCCTCEDCICDECAVDDEDHLDHTFKSLEVIYKGDKQIVEEEFEKVTHYLKKITQSVKKTDRSMELVNMMKGDQLKKIRAHADNAIKELECRTEKQLHEFREQRSWLQHNISDIEQSLEQIRIIVTEGTKKQLISEKEIFLEKCNNIRMNPINDPSKPTFSLKNEIPAFSEFSGIFVIENFSSFIGAEKKIYSDAFTDNNHVWRIFVMTKLPTDSLGIFLELEKGPPCWRECRLEVIHTNADKSVQKIMKNKSYKQSDCRGFANFITLNAILDDKYLKDDDSLEVLFQVLDCEEDSN